MHKIVVTLVILWILLLTRSVSNARQLRDLIPGLYGGDGITLAPPPAGSPFPSHAPHFTFDSAASINRLNEQITAAIGAFPFSSSVGGFTFNLDRGSQSTVEYVIGFDLGTARLTFAGELLGSYTPSGDGSGDHILTASMGVKWNPWQQLLVSANAQVPVNRTGLRSDLILTFGAEYSF